VSASQADEIILIEDGTKMDTVLKKEARSACKLKHVVRILISLLVIIAFCLPASAHIEPYRNYIYDSTLRAQEEPQAYLPDFLITGGSLGTAEFDTPMDVFVAMDKRIYIVDSGNNRILILDEDLNLEKIITEFDNEGTPDTFNRPSGIFVTEYNEIYVADTENSRVVVFREDGSLIKILGRPEVSLFQGEFKYQPIRVAVDNADRVFVVSLNVSEGIVEYDANGNFLSFFGAIRVKRDLTQIFWRALAEYFPQVRDQLRRNIPTEYSSLCVDEYGFILATAGIVSQRDEQIFIRRLNPMGLDVLRRYDLVPPNGDPPMLAYNISSKKVEMTFANLTDIVSRGSRIYSALDQKMGRIFTYSPDGELMYLFGANGTLFGQFGRPVALDVYNEDHYLVVDARYNQIISFKPTGYGAIITNAVREFYNRNYTESGEYWKEAIKFTAKSRLIYDGYAKYLYMQGEYDEAMKYYRYARNYLGFSEAFELSRKEFLDENFVPVALSSLFIIIGFLVYRTVRKRRRMKND
jgi:tetratricopeptide (TPR) repeat protein